MSRLEDIEAIKQLKHKYLRCLDCKNWDEMSACFTDDAVTSYSGGQFCFEGKDKIIDFLKDVMQNTLLTMHQGFHPEIEITGENTAKGSWAFHDYLIELNSNTSIRGYGYYHDEYEKVGGQWKIKSTGYKRVFEESWERNDVPSMKVNEHMFENI